MGGAALGGPTSQSYFGVVRLHFRGGAFSSLLWVVLLFTSSLWVVLLCPHLSIVRCCLSPPPCGGAAATLFTNFTIRFNDVTTLNQLKLNQIIKNEARQTWWWPLTFFFVHLIFLLLLLGGATFWRCFSPHPCGWLLLLLGCW